MRGRPEVGFHKDIILESSGDSIPTGRVFRKKYGDPLRNFVLGGAHHFIKTNFIGRLSRKGASENPFFGGET